MAGKQGLPDEVLRKLASDPDFNSLDEAGQDRIVSRFAQESYKQVDKPQNILQRASQAILQNPRQVGYEVAGGTLPGDVGMGLGMMATGHPFSSGLNQAAKAETMREGEVSKVQNPLLQVGLDMATDPMTWAGFGIGGKKTADTAGFLMNPSKGYGQALEAAGNVDFHVPIMDALSDPLASKVLDKSGVMDKFGGIHLGEGGASSPRLSNLTLKESQDIINLIKGGVSKAVVEGEHLAPKHIPITTLFSKLSEAQNTVPGISGAKKMYGIAKEVPEVVGKVAKRALLGSEIGGGYEVGKGLIKKIFGL